MLWFGFYHHQAFTKVAFFFPDHNALIDLSKNWPFLFIAQANLIKMLRVLFLRSDLSDWSYFARSKATEHLDKSAHFHLFPFSLPIATWQTIHASSSGVLIEITFNWPTVTTVVCLHSSDPRDNNSNIIDIYVVINIFNCIVGSRASPNSRVIWSVLFRRFIRSIVTFS